MTEPSKINARVKDGVVDVRVLMAHEMESGQRRNAAGQLVAAWYISDVTAALNGQPVMKAHWGPAISKNPYLHFRIPGGKPGDRLTITWLDNRGNTRTDEATVT
jgi:sulfur-oxidizing protein SoxZ